MNKFCYSAGEIELADTQCDLCVHQTEGSRETCRKFEKIPEEILLNEKKCPHVRNKNFVDL